MIRALILDVGGTLIWGNGQHFEKANAWRAALLLRERGFIQDAPALADRLVSLRRHSPKEGGNWAQTGTTRQYLQQALTEHGIDVSPELLDWLEREYVRPEAEGAVSIPGMPQLVRSLAGKVRLGVASNTRSHELTTQIIARLGLATLMDPLVTSVSAGYRKPSPNIFGEVLSKWEVEPHEVVMIGDSRRKDVAGAQKLGMKAVWFKAELTVSGGRDAETLTEEVRPDGIATDAESLYGVLQDLGLSH